MEPSDIKRLISLGKFPQAEKEINNLLTANPANEQALLLRFQLLKAQGRIGSAIETVKEAIKVNPNNAESHYHLGLLLADGLDKKKGVEELRNAVELSSGDAEYKSILATYLKDLGETKEAERLVKEALEQNPTSQTIKTNYSIVFMENINSKELVEKIVRENPDDFTSLNNLGVKYIHEKKFKEAENTFRQALKINPTNSIGRENLKLSLRCQLWFYRPMYYVHRLRDKNQQVLYIIIGALVIAYRIEKTFLIIAAPIIFYMVLSGPIGNYFIKNRL